MTRKDASGMVATGATVAEDVSVFSAVSGTITAPSSPVGTPDSSDAAGVESAFTFESEAADDSEATDGSFKRIDDLKPVRHTRPRQSDQNQIAGGVRAGLLILSDCHRNSHKRRKLPIIINLRHLPKPR